MNTPPRHWQNYPQGNIDENEMAQWIAVLPLGAHEQHGPHLPYETDAIIAEGICQNLADKLGEGEKVTILPVEPIGYSPEHLDYEGSKSLSFNVAINRWISIGENLSKLGFRKLVLLNAHGGNSPILSIVATELRVRCSMLVVATSWTRFGTPDNVISDDEKAYGIHGGDVETSVMLALDAKNVDLLRAENFYSLQEKLTNDNVYLWAYGKHAFGWKMQDLNSKGVVGNAAIASIEKGEQLIAHSVRGLVQLIGEVRNFDMDNLKPGDQVENFRN